MTANIYIAPQDAVRVQTHASGYYYSSPIGVATTSAAPALNLWLAMPFFVPVRGTYDRIGCEHTTNTASAVVRLGIVADNGSLYPGDLVLDAGTIDASASAGFKEITIDQELDAGVYWLTACSQGAAPSVRLFNLGLPILGATNPASSSLVIAFQQASVSGEFPATFEPSGVSSSATRVYIRKA